MKNLNIIFVSFPVYSGNVRSLYEFIKQEYPNFNLIWIAKNEKDYKLFKKKNISYVLQDTEDFKKEIENANIFFTSHGQYIYMKRENQIYINLWHGVGIKKIGHMTNEESFTDDDKSYLKDLYINTNYFVVPSEFWKVVYCATFNVEPKRILITGLPRTKYFFEKSDSSVIEKLCKINIKDYSKVLIYLPTFRIGLKRLDGSINNENALNLISYNEKELLDFLEKNKYLLLIKMHPSEQSNNKSENHDNLIYLHDELMTEESIDLNEILKETDLLISDYSSVYIEYLVSQKPVLFLDTDIEKYSKDRGILFNNTSFWFPGPKVNNIEDFINESKKLVKDKEYYNKERLEFLSLMYEDNYDGGCKELCEFLFDEDKLNINYFNFESEEAKLKKEIIRLERDVANKDTQIESLQEETKTLNNEITQIKYSKFWKMSEFYRKIKKTFSKKH